MAAVDSKPEWIDQVLERLDRVEATLAELVRQRTVKDFYSTDQVAQILGKAEFTVREWCRHGRVHAEKKGSGRGKYQAWVLQAVVVTLRREAPFRLQPLWAGERLHVCGAFSLWLVGFGDTPPVHRVISQESLYG
jgi:hypothetical protein